jgi:anti-sigma factor (TIGR02949 family)
MDCKAIEREIYQFIYGDGDADKLRRIKEHLDKCGACVRERDLIAEILVKIKDALPAEELPEGCRERMLEKLRERRKEAS